GHRVPGAEALRGDPRNAETVEKRLDLLFRPHAGMKRIRDALMLEHRADLLADLHTLLIRIAVRPLVHYASTGLEHADCCPQQRLPLGNEVEKTGDGDRVERSRSAGQMRALADH